MVALHLATSAAKRLNIPYLRALHIDTTVAFPENLEYVKRICSRIQIPLDVIRPEVDFWSRVREFGFPTVTRRWCTKYMKFFPTRKFLKKHDFVILIDGIRKSESSERAKRYKEEVTRYWNLRNRYVIHPILNWSKRDVEEYIKRQNLEKNPLYDIYDTAGCYYCPFLHIKHYLKLKFHHPELFQKIVEAEKEMKGSSAFITNHGRKIYARNLITQTNLSRL